MDLNAYIQILRIQHKDESITQYVRGIAFFKNVAHKKMKVKLANPSVILLSGGTEFSGQEPKLLSMEAVLTQEPDYTQIFTRKLTKLKPSLVMVERSMSQWVISELARCGITAIVNVKRKVLDLVARVTQGKTLLDIDQASSQHGIGHCTEVIVRKYPRVSVVFIKSDSEATPGGSIILSGPDLEELRRVKKLIREMILLYRNLKLELSVLAQLGINYQRDISAAEKEVTFQCLTVAGKVCSKPKTVSVQLYSREDTPLGQWVMDTHKRLGQVCSICGVLEVSHKHYYLKEEGLVLIEFALKPKGGESNEEIKFHSQCMTCGAESSPVILNLWTWEYSFNRFIANYLMSERTEVLSTCNHSLFREGKVWFSFGNYDLAFSYASKPMYDLLPLRRNLNLTSYYERITSETISRIVNASGELYDYLRLEINEIMSDVLMLKNLNTDLLPSLEEFMSNLSETQLSVLRAKKEMKNVHPLPDVLQAEYFRRSQFLDISNIKIKIQAFKKAFKSLSSGKQQTIDWTTLTPDLQASPGTPVTHESESGGFRSSAIHRHSSVPSMKSRLTTDSNSGVTFPGTWEALEKTDSLLASPAFQYMQAGNPTLPVGMQNTFTPVVDADPLSVIAYMLNSQKYNEEVYKVFNLSVDLNECIESELLSGSELTHESFFNTYDFSDQPGKGDLMKVYGPSVSFHVHAYYAMQFQAIRLFLCQSPQEFLLSIYRSKAEQQNLGKSGARFFTTHDEKYIAKIVEEKEFQMFVDMAPNYFRHVCKNFYHNMPSCLVRTVGVYKFSMKPIGTSAKKTAWVLLMENLGCGINPKAVAYDLKGTLNSRRYVKEGDKQTKMDLNFIEDMSALPISLSTETKQLLESSLWNDTLFLSKQNVIDYSLVVHICREDRHLSAGLIDYLRQYTFDKAIESKYKKVIANELPTITDPTEYKQRFRAQVMKDYFLAIDSPSPSSC